MLGLTFITLFAFHFSCLFYVTFSLFMLSFGLVLKNCIPCPVGWLTHVLNCCSVVVLQVATCVPDLVESSLNVQFYFRVACGPWQANWNSISSYQLFSYTCHRYKQQACGSTHTFTHSRAPHFSLCFRTSILDNFFPKKTLVVTSFSRVILLSEIVLNCVLERYFH